MPRDSISASTSLRVPGSDVARFLLSTYAILPPETAKSPGGHLAVAAEAPSPRNVVRESYRSSRTDRRATLSGDSACFALLRRPHPPSSPPSRSRSAPHAAPSPGKQYVAPAGSGALFLVSGHGWGHGVGMGQWGAQGYALQGYTYDQILAAYYPGTTLGPDDRDARSASCSPRARSR